jgi:hypothetical protein
MSAGFVIPTLGSVGVGKAGTPEISLSGSPMYTTQPVSVHRRTWKAPPPPPSGAIAAAAETEEALPAAWRAASSVIGGCVAGGGGGGVVVVSLALVRSFSLTTAGLEETHDDASKEERKRERDGSIDRGRSEKQAGRRRARVCVLCCVPSAAHKGDARPVGCVVLWLRRVVVVRGRMPREISKRGKRQRRAGALDLCKPTRRF